MEKKATEDKPMKYTWYRIDYDLSENRRSGMKTILAETSEKWKCGTGIQFNTDGKEDKK